MLGITKEIREYGSTAIQVMRRMRAMLEELRDEVRAEHRPAVEEELARLEMTVARTFADSVDLDRANTADPQGIGGQTEAPDEEQDDWPSFALTCRASGAGSRSAEADRAVTTT